MYLPNLDPTCDSFDEGDPELWIYLGLPPHFADTLAKCESSYWKDWARQLANEDACDEVAEHARLAFLQQQCRWIERRKLRLEFSNWLTYLGMASAAQFGHPLTFVRESHPDDVEVDEEGMCAARDELIKFLKTRPRAESRYPPSGPKQRQRLPDGAVYRRGPRLTQQFVLELMPEFSVNSTSAVQWGPLRYPRHIIDDSHFCVSGMPRSGKTTMLRLLFQSLHAESTDRPRFVLYDAKPDLLPSAFPPGYLAANPQATVESEFYLLNPFDKRTTAWDIAADASDTAKAREIAHILFPVVGDGHSYFYQAPRDLAVAAMDALREKAGHAWTLYDLLVALQPENITAVLRRTSRGQQLVATYLSGDRPSVGDLFGTLAEKTALCLPMAWAWRQATHRLSLREWVQSDSKSIVLGNNHEHYEANKEINRILLNVLTHQLLAVEQNPQRTFLYLDEFEHLGYISVLKRLAEMGAARRVNLALAFHDLDTLKTVYGGETEGILAMCNFFAFFAVRGRGTANWASELLGMQEVLLLQTSSQRTIIDADDNEQSTIRTQQSYSTTLQPVTRQLVLADEIMHLPRVHEEKGSTAFYLTPLHFPYKGHLPASRPGGVTAVSFESLWTAEPAIQAYAPQTALALTPPNDTFATLHELGFEKEDYSTKSPVVSPTVAPSASIQKDEARRPKPDLRDLDFTFRPPQS